MFLKETISGVVALIHAAKEQDRQERGYILFIIPFGIYLANKILVGVLDLSACLALASSAPNPLSW